MTYIIQGTNGSLKYWVKRYPGNTRKDFCWVGIIESATRFETKRAAQLWLFYNSDLLSLPIEIAEYVKK